MIYKEDGNLSEHGKEKVTNLKNEIRVLLEEGTSEQEIRIIGSILQNIVGNLTNEKIVNG